MTENCRLWNFSPGEARRRRLYILYGKAAQRSMAENYQLAFLTPGIWPL